MTEEKTYTPTEAVLNNIRKASAICKLTGRPKAEWSYVAKSEFSLVEVKELYQRHLKFINKHLNPLTRLSDGGPSEEYMEFLASGGSAGLAWTRSILEENQIIKSYLGPITDEQLNKEEKVIGFELKIEKQHNEELMQVTYVAMLPDSTDLTGDYTSAEDVRKAMESFNKSAMRANLFHRLMTDKFHVVESYIAPTDFVLNDIPVKKGTWLMTLQVNDEKVWKMIKSGDINGISIGAMAKVETIKDDDD